MGFSTEWRDDRIVITVDGPFSECSQALQQELLATLERGNRHIEMDLREAEGPDIIALVAMQQEVHKYGGTLQILPNPRMQRVLEMTGLSNILGRSEPGDGGLAGRFAPFKPQPPGPIQGRAEAPVPSPETPIDGTDTPT